VSPEIAVAPAATVRRTRRRQRARGPVSLMAQGTPLVWLTAGGLVLCLCMVLGLLGLVAWEGVRTFRQGPLVLLHLRAGGAALGEVASVEDYRPEAHAFEALPPELRATAEQEVRARGGHATRTLLRTGNYELTNEHYRSFNDFEIVGEERPEWALLIERLSWGRFYGFPRALLVDGRPEASEPEQVWERFRREFPRVEDRRAERQRIEKDENGALNARIERARLALREAELEYGQASPEWRAEEQSFHVVEREAGEEAARLRERTGELERENARYELELVTADGVEKRIPLAEIVRVVPANHLGFAGRVGLYLSRWREFLLEDPRAANSEGGVFPAMFGTVTMTLLMTLVVVPIGVLAALYLREYAKSRWIVGAVRIAINNLAGVPSIVYGVFGLGFFCHLVGGSIDDTFFRARLPAPTFNTGGIMWASLTLALLTLPVVIVATEEALAAVPNSMREGSFACGASKWQTIRRIVLPRALPGITTGMILAMARGAGEVAPLMLVGAVKLAPALPVDGTFPFVHPERSFMHLGFHIYDLGFQAQNSEAAKPMVFTTTMLLIAIVVTLNLTAIAVRARLHRRFKGSHI